MAEIGKAEGMQRLGLKRILSVALVATLLLTIPGSTGCGGKTQDGLITLTVFNMDTDYAGEETGELAEELAERFGVKLQYVTATEDTLVAREESGFIGDIVIFNTQSAFETAAGARLLFDWQEEGFLEGNAPAIVAAYSEAMKGIEQSDAIYGIACGLSDGTKVIRTATSLIRWDLYAQLGYPQMQSMDDLKEVLLEMQALQPQTAEGKDVYAISTSADLDTDMVGFVADMVELFGYMQTGLGFYHPESGEYQSVLEPDGIYVSLLREMNEWYLEGLIDPVSMTQPGSSLIDKIADGQVLFGMDGWGVGTYNTQEHLAGGSAMEPVLLGDYRVVTYALGEHGDNRTVAIGATATYPELCLEVIDWLYSEEAGSFLTEAEHLPVLVYRSSADMSISEAETDGQYEIESNWQSYAGAQSGQEYYVNAGATTSETAYVTIERPEDTELLIAWNAVGGELCTGSWNAIYAQSTEEFDAIIAKMNAECDGYGMQELLDYCRGEFIQ